MLIHANDPYWPSVSLLVKNTGVNGANNNTFLDSSPNNLTITRNGNVAQGSFGPATNVSSGYFDGSGDYLTVPYNAALSMGSGDWTVEAWVRYTALTTYGKIIGNGFTAELPNYVLDIGGSGNRFRLITGTSSAIQVNISSTTIPVVNTWYHVAFSKQGTIYRLFINGVLEASATTASVPGNTNSRPLNIGYEPGSDYLNGYIALTRISNIARYTSNFTPSTSYKSDNNTVLFLEYSNASIYDATGKGNVETVGNASVSNTVTQFGLPTISFDGTGDYLSIPDNSGFAFGSGDFTIEMWVRTNTLKTESLISQWAGLGTRSFNLLFVNTGMVQFYWSADGTNSSVAQSSAGVVASNTLYFIQVVRTGSTIIIRRNGTQIASAAIAGALYDSSTALIVGRGIEDGSNAQDIDCYIPEIRITKGVARVNTTPIMPSSTY